MADPSPAPLTHLPRRIAVRATASLLAIGALVVLGQLLIQEAIERQVADSRVLNLAGRQRMLSQRLAKAALAAELAIDRDAREAHLAELEHSTDLLERVHRALQHGDRGLALPGRNSRTVAEAFRALDPHLRALVGASRDLAAALRRRGRGPADEEATDLARVLAAEPSFLRAMEDVMAKLLGEEPAYLARMDAIVTEYEGEAREHVAAVKLRQLAFVAATLIVLAFLGCGVLLPVIRQLRRTVELREAEARARLSRSLLDASMRERQRIGRDLHDGVGQILVAIGMMSRALAQRLAARGAPEADDARRIESSAADAVAQTRDLARALHPVDVAGGDMSIGLRALADYAELTFGVQCTFECDRGTRIADEAAATHVYRIAQEAITNAIKHGRARRIAVALHANGPALRLSVVDDGVGIHRARRRGRGLGLENMRDRAGMLGGTLDVAPRIGGGTVVTARFRTGAAGMIAA